MCQGVSQGVDVTCACRVRRSELESLDLTGAVAVSAETGFGLSALMERLEMTVIENTDRVRKTFRVPMAGQHVR